MTGSASDRDGSVTQKEPPVTGGPDIPETDDDWFALITSEIDMSPEEADEGEIIELAQQHAEQVIERTEMAVNLEPVAWRATRELRAKHGYHQGNFIKLSIHSLETHGWQEFLRVVRHELVHAWQHQNNIDDRPAKNKFKRFHGPSFEQWMPILNIAKLGPYIIPRWTIECPKCQALLDRKHKVRNKKIAQRIQTLDREVCHECDQQLSEYTIKRNGEEIAVESLPNVLSKAQDWIFLYNKPSMTAESVKREWNPQTRRLTAFTGIGEVTARELGRDINCIDELLDVAEGTLATDVQAVVPAPYHESLHTEVRAKYEEALRNRSSDDVELLNQVMSHHNEDWWEPIECLDRTGPVESICLLLRDEVEPEDRLQITVEGYGEYTAQVDVTGVAERRMVGVTIEPDSTPLGSEAIIEVPSPHRGDYPTLKYSKELPESDLWITGDGSTSRYEDHRATITDVEKQEAASR